jgi:hypothetical protein
MQGRPGGGGVLAGRGEKKPAPRERHVAVPSSKIEEIKRE